MTDLDDHVAEILRKSKKPVILVANKVDSNDWLYNVPEFYSLGLGDPYPVSAVNGFGTGDLLDEVVKKLPEEDPNAQEQLDEIPKFAIVGRPNAGKSSLINAFIGCLLYTSSMAELPDGSIGILTEEAIGNCGERQSGGYRIWFTRISPEEFLTPIK